MEAVPPEPLLQLPLVLGQDDELDLSTMARAVPSFRESARMSDILAETMERCVNCFIGQVGAVLGALDDRLELTALFEHYGIPLCNGKARTFSYEHFLVGKPHGCWRYLQ